MQVVRKSVIKGHVTSVTYSFNPLIRSEVLMTDLQLSVLLSDVENMRMRIGALERHLHVAEDVFPAATEVETPEQPVEEEAAVTEEVTTPEYDPAQVALWKVAEHVLKDSQRAIIAAIIASPSKSNEVLASELSVTPQTIAKWRRSCVEAGVVRSGGRGRGVLRVEDKREFDNLQHAAETLVEDGKTKANVASVRQNLYMAIKSGRRAYDYTWKYLG